MVPLSGAVSFGQLTTLQDMITNKQTKSKQSRKSGYCTLRLHHLQNLATMLS